MNKENAIVNIKVAAENIRKHVLRLTLERNGSYLTQACSAAEILATLYLDVLNLTESKAPMIPGEFPGTPSKDNMNYIKGSAYHGSIQAPFDRLFISPAHYAAPVYSALIEAGRLSEDALEFFNQDGYAMEMIGANHTPGFESAAGTLAQAYSVACGTAHARKLKNEEGRIFTFMSDGEMQEGQLWETIQAAVFHKLDNTVLLVDVNGQQVEGRVKDIMRIEPLDKRFEAFGAKVAKINGHDIHEIREACSLFEKDKPLVILCYTSPSHGIPLLKHRTGQMHFVRLNKETEYSDYKTFYEGM